MKRTSLAIFFLAVLAPRPSVAEETGLVLQVTPEPGGPWKLRIENQGSLPQRISADPRLLVLDLDSQVAAKNAKPLRCMLPGDARPADEGRELVIPGKRSWTVTIDPLFYCFGAKERAALVPGTVVRAHFGWPAARDAKPTTKPPIAPFVATPVGAAVGQVAAAKELVSAPFTLTEGVGVPPGPAGDPGPLVISSGDAVDSGTGLEIPITVTLANVGERPQSLLFLPETILFTVSGPAGSVVCGTQRVVGSPIRELYMTLGKKQRSSFTVLLPTYCPTETFDEPGAYRVRVKLDTSAASGRSVGIRSWDGVVAATTPTLVRVRAPRHPMTPPRPTLDGR